jgi:hypothetical protein
MRYMNCVVPALLGYDLSDLRRYIQRDMILLLFFLIGFKGPWFQRIIIVQISSALFCDILMAAEAVLALACGQRSR